MPKFRTNRYFLYCLRVLTVLFLSVQFDHVNFGQFSDLRFNLEIFVFSAVIFTSSISSEIPIKRLKLVCVTEVTTNYSCFKENEWPTVIMFYVL